LFAAHEALRLVSGRCSEVRDLQGLENAGAKSGLGEDRHHVPGIDSVIASRRRHKASSAPKFAHAQWLGQGGETSKIPGTNGGNIAQDTQPPRVGMESAREIAASLGAFHGVLPGTRFPCKTSASTVDPRARQCSLIARSL
jgi:hypothetical protein